MGLYLIGCGGHAKVVLSTLREAGVQPDGFLDDDRAKVGTCVIGLQVVGCRADFSGKGHSAIIAIGDNRVRSRLAEEGGFEWESAIHSRAWVDSTATVGEGTVVFAGVVVQPDTAVGSHVILNTACSVDHDCRIGDYCHVAPGVHLAGAVTVEEGAFLGIGCAVIPNRRIGSWSIVGAGAAVVKDVPAGATVVGCPAEQSSPS